MESSAGPGGAAEPSIDTDDQTCWPAHFSCECQPLLLTASASFVFALMIGKRESCYSAAYRRSTMPERDADHFAAMDQLD
jgi:hypothetical protein